MAGRLIGGIGRADIYNGGNYKIVGVVQGVTGPRKVRLLLSKEGTIIRQTWCESNGNYAFNNLKYQNYTCYTIDHLRNYKCAITGDNVTMELMT
jgi:hypothetical protein